MSLGFAFVGAIIMIQRRSITRYLVLLTGVRAFLRSLNIANDRDHVTLNQELVIFQYQLIHRITFQIFVTSWVASYFKVSYRHRYGRNFIYFLYLIWV